MPSSVSRETSADLANPSEMVERVALAMCVWSEEATYCSTDWPAWIELATIAVRTIRKPTEAMEDAGAAQVVKFSVDCCEEVVAYEAWTAMANEALEAKTK